MLYLLGVVLWFSVLGSFGKARALRDARGSSEGRIEPDDGGARLLNDFRLLTAYGQIEKTYEGVNTKKIVRYEISGKDVGEEIFFAVANATGLSMVFESRAGDRGYPNQDNFMVDIVQNGTSMDSASSLIGLYVIWDGHGTNAHLLTKLLRLVVTKLWRTEVEKLLKLSSSDSSGRESKIKRIARQLFLRSQNEYDNVVAEKANGVSVLGGTDSSEVKGAELLRAGSTMSVVIVDYVDDKIYCATVGDSPVYGRSTDQKKLIPLAEDHNVAGPGGLEAVVQRLKADGYVYNTTERWRDSELSRYFYMVWFAKPSEPAAEAARQAIDMANFVFPDRIMIDLRIGSLQMAKELGSHAHDGGVSYEPSIIVYDLKQQPMQYILMASDGLTHGLEILTESHVDSVLIEFDEHPVEEFGMKVPQYYKNTFVPMIYADRHNATEVLDRIRKFGEVHDRRALFTSQLVEETIRRVVDEVVQQGDLRVFADQMLVLSELEGNADDDLTTMFIGLPQTAAAKQREEELSPSSSSHSAARNLTHPDVVFDALKSEERKSVLAAMEGKGNDKQNSE